MKAKIKGLAIIIIGLMLVAAAFLVFSGGANVLTITSDKLESDANGELVYVTGALKPKEPLEDTLFGISESDNIGLRRVVEVYQWQEEPDGSYIKVWSEDLIDSSIFAQQEGHANPVEKWAESLQLVSDNVSLGVYSLHSRLQQKITPSEWQPIAFTPEQYSALPATGKKAFKLFDGKLFYGLEPENPRIGDMQISFQRSPVQVSVVAELAGAQLMPDTQSGESIHKIRTGIVNKDAMLESMELPDGLMRWIVLGVGGLVSLVGVFVLLTSKPKTEEFNEDEFAVEDEFAAPEEHDEHDVDTNDALAAGPDVTPEMAEGVDAAAPQMNDDLASAASDLAQNAGIEASDGNDEFGGVAPMDTPGMDPSQQDDEPLQPAPTPEVAPEPEAPIANEPSLEPEPSPLDDGGFEDDGIDFTPMEDEEPHQDLDSEPAQAPADAPQAHAETMQPEPSTSDDFSMPEEDIASAENQAVENDVQTQEVEPSPSAEVEQVMPMAEEAYAPSDYVESDEEIGDEMFLLDDEQEEGGSEPTEVSLDDAPQPAPEAPAMEVQPAPAPEEAAVNVQTEEPVEQLVENEAAQPEPQSHDSTVDEDNEEEDFNFDDDDSFDDENDEEDEDGEDDDEEFFFLDDDDDDDFMLDDDESDLEPEDTAEIQADEDSDFPLVEEESDEENNTDTTSDAADETPQETPKNEEEKKKSGDSAVDIQEF